MKSMVCFLALFIILGFLNYAVSRKEAHVREGKTVLLELASQDPRSLMQGDHMVLRYVIARRLDHLKGGEGQIVLSVDENGVATFMRLHNGKPLAENEVLLNYQTRGNRFRTGISFGAQTFFFEEGTADIYATARYGELRVDDNGKPVLVGLRDSELNILGKRLVAQDASWLIIGGGSGN